VPDKTQYIMRSGLKCKHPLVYGYTLKQIGEYVGSHYSTVSKVIRKRERRSNRYSKTPLLAGVANVTFLVISRSFLASDPPHWLEAMEANA